MGAVGATAAQLFTLLLDLFGRVILRGVAGYVPPGLPWEGGVLAETVGRSGHWLIPLATATGGLLVGLLTRNFAPEAEGHGTDTVVKAFHRAAGVLRGRVPPVKLLASALTIGSGGSGGREGPVALVSAGVGSWYARVTQRTESDRRLLLLIGMAAGLAAIFRSPIGTALFAIEVLYRDMEFESGALLYTMLASIVAYAINGLFSGWRPLFLVPAEIHLAHQWDYLWYVVLGITAGVVATIHPQIFYGIRDYFRRLAIPGFLKPALGGLVMGLLALAFPQVIGGGYGWIQLAIDGRLALTVVPALILAKMVATGLTVGSGGSGGVFAPTLFVGAMLGGTLASLTGQPPAALVVVGMAAVFAGTAHVPVATLIMVTEMTGGYTLLVPAALAVMLSSLVTALLSGRMKYPSLYEEQVATRSESPAHQSEALAIGLRLLRQQPVLARLGATELDLARLLQGGVSVTLPQSRLLALRAVRAHSAYVGRVLGSEAMFQETGTRVLAVSRDDDLVPLGADTALAAGDRLILLTTHKELERLGDELEIWPDARPSAPVQARGAP